MVVRELNPIEQKMVLVLKQVRYPSIVGEFHRLGNLGEQGREVFVLSSSDPNLVSNLSKLESLDKTGIELSSVRRDVLSETPVVPVPYRTVYTRGPANNLYLGFD